MNDSINDNVPTEPIPPVDDLRTEQQVEPAHVPTTAGSHRAAIIAGAIAVALVLAVGVFAAGAAVGGRMNRGAQRQYALSGQAQDRGPGMMPGQGGQGQMRGPGGGRDRGFDGDGDGGHGRRGGRPDNRNFGGQGSTSPTASVPAVPGQ